MSSLMQKLTQFSKSKQGRSLVGQARERLTGGGRPAGRAKRRRPRGR
jgi:hypothetical protein